MRTLSQTVRKWQKIYLSPFIVPRRGLHIHIVGLYYNDFDIWSSTRSEFLTVWEYKFAY